MPALVIYGEKDLQVSPEINQPAMSNTLPKAMIITYPGLNHLMQHAKTGEIKEYAQIEETISEEVVAQVAEFVLSAVK